LELTNTYRVDVPVAQAWAVLTDLPRTAACLPGAVLAEASHDHGQGSLRVRVGAVTVACAGIARLTVPEAGHQAVITVGPAQDGADHDGADHHGAAVTVTATLRPWGLGTELSLVTGLTPPAALAQAGPGIIADAGSRLLTQFARNLEAAAAQVAPVQQEVAPVQETVAGKAAADETEAPADPVPGQPPMRIPAARIALAAAGPVLIALVLIVRRLAAKQQWRQIL
jgi:uncharacterized protein